MRVLVACEYSGRVRRAFRARGHDAYSCDLLPAEDGNVAHYVGDVLDCLSGGFFKESGGWDLLIAHPPCTHLSVSGARHFEEKRADGRQQEAIEFFMALARAPIPRIAIENPVCIMSSVWREPDQIIQPWEYGHGETKATCLWLKGLPRLRPTKIVAGREPRVHFMPPGPNRWKERSRTYEGIAEAMADQWGDYTDLVTAMEAAHA
jgi:site-specific DNA-cytosine methylase